MTSRDSTGFFNGDAKRGAGIFFTIDGTINESLVITAILHPFEILCAYCS